MALKVVVLFCLVVVLLGVATGAPLETTKNRDITNSFAEFLKQDKELSAALHRIDNGLVTRLRRAVEGDDDLSEQDVDGSKEPGFFDRAAKFVMEVLQRFLKWINSDN